MDAFGIISQPVMAPVRVSAPPPAAAGPTTVQRGSSDGLAKSTIRLEIRRDDNVDRVIFEYRKRDSGELVQRFPAKQVVQFYQMMEAMAARAANGGDVARTASDASVQGANPKGGGTVSGAATLGVDRFDSDIPVADVGALESADTGGPRLSAHA